MLFAAARAVERSIGAMVVPARLQTRQTPAQRVTLRPPCPPKPRIDMVPTNRNHRRARPKRRAVLITGRKAAPRMLGTIAQGGIQLPRTAAEGIELLADPTRRRIVALIAGSVRHPSDIAAAIGLSRPAVSRQLLLLTQAGLLRWRWSNIDLRSRVYAIDPAMAAPIIAWLAGVDLRNVRPLISPTWSPPARPHRLRHDARLLDLDHDGSA